MRIAATAVLLLTLLVPTVGADESHLPPEFRGLPPGEFSKAVERALESRLGSEFPNWELRGRNGRRDLYSVSSGPIVVLYGGGPCPSFLEQIRFLKAEGWTHPEGKLVAILKNKRAYKDRDVRKALKGSSEAYYLRRWDEHDLMNYVRAYPTYLLIDNSRRLVAFKIGDGEWHRSTDGD